VAGIAFHIQYKFPLAVKIDFGIALPVDAYIVKVLIYAYTKNAMLFSDNQNFFLLQNPNIFANRVAEYIFNLIYV